MKRSNFFMPMRRDTSRTSPSATVKSDAYFDRLGYVHKIGAGIYTHLPAGHRLFGNVKSVLNRRLVAAGSAEHQFPAIHPTSIWKESGRFEKFGPIMFNFIDQHGKGVCLAPTHEILAAITAKQFVRSYRDLPIRITQTQTKFRDEKRPRGGVMRTLEFTMQDLYAFDADAAGANVSYGLIVDAYRKTLTELRIPFRVKEQTDMGSIGGLRSHEFHVLAESGEDNYVDPEGRTVPSIEIAHTFNLGTTYTQPIAATYMDRNGTNKLIYMCSFGLGVERTAAAFVENYLRDGEDLIWSWALAPFQIVIIGAQYKEAWAAHDALEAAGFSALIDDRAHVPFAQQWKEARLMGAPIYVVFGKTFDIEEKAEVLTSLSQRMRYVDPEDVTATVREAWAEVEAAELIRMSFGLGKIDTEQKTALVRIQDPVELDRSFCETFAIGTDLLGNFGSKRFEGEKRLRAGQFWLVPVVEQPGHEVRAAHHEGFQYYIAPSLDEFAQSFGR